MIQIRFISINYNHLMIDYFSQGLNSSARQRRRENKVQSSSTEYLTSNESPNQTAINNESQDNLIAEIEKKKEG